MVKEWTYLLFEEFFVQGDNEKQQQLPISMLCDRETTNVAKSQPGFINFVVLPLYQIVGQILPVVSQKDGCIDTLKQNCERWQKYEETEEDKEIYKKKTHFQFDGDNYPVIDVENDDN